MEVRRRRGLRPKIPIEAKNLKVLLLKTLEKLDKYKDERKTMQEKIDFLQNALEFKDMLREQFHVVESISEDQP